MRISEVAYQHLKLALDTLELGNRIKITVVQSSSDIFDFKLDVTYSLPQNHVIVPYKDIELIADINNADIIENLHITYIIDENMYHIRLQDQNLEYLKWKMHKIFETAEAEDIIAANLDGRTKIIRKKVRKNGCNLDIKRI